MHNARSPLSDPRFGLAWSNRDAAIRALIEAALLTGTFYLILEAVHAHGIEEVDSVFCEMKADDTNPISEKLRTRIDKAIGNIKKAIEDVRTSC